MDLKTYIQADRGRASRLADKLGISRSYLSQLASGKAPLSAKRCVAIERETEREVTRQEMKPSEWADIWPDLIPPGEPPRRRKDDQYDAAPGDADQASLDS